MNEDEGRRADEAIVRIISALERAERDISSHLAPRSADVTSASSINVNAGGIGIYVGAWIASVCCVAMLVAGGMFMWSVNSRLDQQDTKIAKQDEKLVRMQDYLNAIYMMAPQLKPKEEK